MQPPVGFGPDATPWERGLPARGNPGTVQTGGLAHLGAGMRESTAAGREMPQ